MTVTNVHQLQQLLLSGGFGFLLGIYYELFRLWRLWFRSSPRAIFFQDLVFFVTASAATFLFDLCLSGGMFRLYLFLGIGLGFAVYYVTVGRLVMSVSRRLMRRLKAAWQMAKNILLRPWHALCARCRTLWYPINIRFTEKTQLIRGFFSKKLLKKREEVLYNQEK